MKIKGVDFREQLLNAQREGSLVVFAGAGVSMGPPSNYPSFNGLVEEVASWAGKKWQEGDEPPERFLGRLVHEGKNVHEQVVRLLSDPDSKHKSLHENLLKLFGGQEQVRIVTTNFDFHFNSAAKKIFGQLPEVFRAPALPLGNDFSGIVYLHGSVLGDPRRLVLTDQDFGRAYLTEGWATRFLQAMFSQYTVLFVGYSHADMVMHYLSRGLPPGSTKPRFALVRADEGILDWRYRGIEPLPYSFEGENDHSQLSVAIAAWIERANRGALETEQRIKELVMGPPPLDDESQDFLKWAVTDTVAARFFARHAKGPEWLLWASERKSLDPLFAQGDLSQVDREIADWVVENFVVQHADIIFAVLEGYHNVVNPWFGYEIARRLAYRDPTPDGSIISKWVPVLLQNKPLSTGFEFAKLLEMSTEQGALAAVAQLFEYFTKPHLLLKKRISWDGDDSDKNPKADAELGFSGDYSLLNEIWEKYLKLKLPELALSLWPGVFQNLNHAYQLYKSWGKADSTWDVLSWNRSAIEPHEQDKYPHDEGVLINAARDCLYWALNNVPQTGLAWIESLSVMEPLILRRLAVYGVTFADLTANDKINWLLNKDFVLTFGLKHEVFQLLKNAYPDAEPGVRRILLHAITVKEHLPEDDEAARATKDYEKFNILYWLSQSAPDCQEVASRLASIKEKRPDFIPREHPDMDHWISDASWVGPRSPVSVEDLLKQRPTEWFEYFVTFKGEDFFRGPDRNGLLHNIGEAVKQDFDWGRELSDLLIDQDKPASDLWESVIRGWNDAKLSEKCWEYVLSALDDERLATHHYHYISDLLQRGVEKEEAIIPLKLFGKADSVAQKVWATLQDEGNEEMKDWLQRAINHPGGKLAMFWLHALYRMRKEADLKDEGLPQPYRMSFETIVSENNEAATLGRVVLASQLEFLFAMDQDWTKENIIPLLDWDRDVQKAQQAWDGWLSCGRLTEPLLPEIIPLYKKSFSHISSELQGVRGRFVQWVVNISLFWMDDPLANRWVPDFLQATEEQDRVTFATHVGNQLMRMKADTMRGLWDRWLKRYWEGRNQGTPIPLADGELKNMVEWVGELEPVFPEAVEVICEGRVPQFEHSSLFWRLEKKEAKITTNYPDDLARLLIHLTASPQMPRYFCGELEKLTEKIVTAGASATILRRLCDNLAAIGCVRAGKLSSMIK